MTRHVFHLSLVLAVGLLLQATSAAAHGHAPGTGSPVECALCVAMAKTTPGLVSTAPDVRSTGAPVTALPTPSTPCPTAPVARSAFARAPPAVA